jgi:DNA-binding transcriptional LysR family regulator
MFIAFIGTMEASMDRFEAMQVFCKVVELGSFAGAAERLGMSTSAVSRQLAQLEALLDARLLNRTTRRINLTENGRAYYERCLQLLADLEETEELAGTHTSSPRGTLRLTAPISFGASHVAPALGAYASLHPQMKFDLMLADRAVDLIEDGLDLAIRVGYLGSQNLVARQIGSTRMLLCASPAYLAARGTPQTPDDLSQHDCMTYAYASNNNQWSFERTGEAAHLVRVTSRIHANNGSALSELAAAGLGITHAPEFILAPLVAQGRLLEILPDWQTRRLAISAVYPSRKHLSAKVRSFVAFMEQWLSKHTNTSAARAHP